MKNLALIALGLAAACFILGGIVAVETRLETIVLSSRGWLLTCTAFVLASIAVSQLEIINRLGK